MTGCGTTANSNSAPGQKMEQQAQRTFRVALFGYGSVNQGLVAMLADPERSARLRSLHNTAVEICCIVRSREIVLTRGAFPVQDLDQLIQRNVQLSTQELVRHMGNGAIANGLLDLVAEAEDVPNPHELVCKGVYKESNEGQDIIILHGFLVFVGSRKYTGV